MKKSERVCCIIGGTSGIGKAVAAGFSRSGDIVIVSGRDIRKIRAVRKELGLRSLSPVETPCDVTKKKTLQKLLRDILRAHGRVDVLVVTAGAHLKKKALDTQEKEWKRVLDVNLTGTFLADQVFGSEMVRRKKGCIINIGSLASVVALTKTCAYNAAKAGVAMLTKSLSVEWAQDHVRVNAILPGVIPTPLNKKALSDRQRLGSILSRTPMKRLGRPEEIVSAALFLASEDSSFVTGSCVSVDGGFLAWSGF